VKNTDIDNLYSSIDDLYSSLESILENMSETNPTKYISLSNLLSRVIIIAAASEFEVRITEAIASMKVDNIKIKELVKKFTTRQFWNMFSFNEKSKNINHFLSYFGEDFEKSVSKEINNNTELNQDMEYFIKLVQWRNKLSHEGFLRSNIPWTYNESFDRYKKAKNLIEFIESKLLE